VKLVTIDAPPTGRTGVLIGDDVLDFALAGAVVPLAGWVPTAMPALLAGGSEGIDLIRRIIDSVAAGREDSAARLRAAKALRPLVETALLAPVPRPGIVLSHGRAYWSHLKEMKRANSEDDPHAFMKNVNAIIGPGAPIVLPPQCPGMVDLEGEFSVVFGKPCHNVTEEDAMDAVIGYTLVNDVSARDWVENFQKTADPDLNRMGKQLPGFCPMGPVIATKDEIPDPHDVHMVSAINGKVMQDAHTSDLIWKVSALIAFFARWYRFMPGDVLTTGSPAGVGYGRTPKIFLKAGDLVTVTVDQVGTLANPIRAAAAAH
jgi:2-keto-4-pentenoate hydratase/2-oxohepta-3-ene-1,7-dioic acid hydratase in catechol pathway